MARNPINSQWFYDQLDSRGLSLRRAAAQIGMDPASMSRSFKGSRRLQSDEISALANLFRKPIEETMRQAGVTDEPPLLAVDFMVEADGRVEWLLSSHQRARATLTASITNEVRAKLRAWGRGSYQIGSVRRGDGPMAAFAHSIVVIDGHPTANPAGKQAIFKNHNGWSLGTIVATDPLGVSVILGMDGRESETQILEARQVHAILPA